MYPGLVANGYLSGTKGQGLLLHGLVEEPIFRRRTQETSICTHRFAGLSHWDDANLLRRRRVLPYRRNKYGKGSMATVRKASTLDPHWKPSELYICSPKRGKAAWDEDFAVSSTLSSHPPAGRGC